MERPDLGRLGIELMLWASLQPEVPTYIWREDPLWEGLPKRLGQADAYAQKLEAFVAEGDLEAAELLALKELVAAQKATLLCMQQGQLAEAEALELHARQLEAVLAEMLSLFSWPKAERRAVYEKATQTSRYDKTPESQGTVQVLCAFRGCKKPQTLEFSRTNSWYTPTCVECGRSFLLFIARLLDLQTQKQRGQVHYVLRLEDAQHKHMRVEFADGSGDEWQGLPRDYLALLYAWNAPGAVQATSDAELSAVVNLTRKHVFWVSKVGNCFVATAFLGEEAEELRLFRRFRDEVLLQNFWGRLAVGAYTVAGPTAARLLRALPWLRSPIRRRLRGIHRRLQAGMGKPSE